MGWPRPPWLDRWPRCGIWFDGTAGRERSRATPPPGSAHLEAPSAYPACCADELGQLLDEDANPERPTAARDDAILELLYGSGLRVSELCGIDLGDLDLERGLARVLGKGSKERLVPVGDAAVAALRAHVASAEAQLVGDGPAHLAAGCGPELFRNARGKRLAPATFVASSIAARPFPPIPMRSVTVSPPTCSTVGPICVRYKSCWAMPTWRRPRSIRTSAGNACGPPCTPHTPEPDRSVAVPSPATLSG